jgi:hypothetical protein
MSQWGKLDYVPLVGTAIANLNSTTVICSTGSFTEANVELGDALLISNVAYRVSAITSNTTITLDTRYTGANASGLGLAVQQSPKDISTLGWTANATYTLPVSKRNVYGVDRVEVAAASNKANGISHTGWVYYDTYTTTQGAVRNKSEVLVAMSKNFNANATGVLRADANDDLDIKDN